MRFALWGVSLLLAAETLRFLFFRLRAHARADPASFPSDPLKAARLSPASLAVSDRTDTLWRAGLLFRTVAAAAGLSLAAWSSRPAVPAPEPPPKPAAPADPFRVVGDTTFSAKVPAGWSETWRAEGMGARYAPSEPGGADAGVYIAVSVKPRGEALTAFDDFGMPTPRFETEGVSIAGTVGQRRSVARTDPAGRRESLERWLVVQGETGYLVECFGREGRIADMTAACGAFTGSFRIAAPAPAAPASN